MGTTGPAGPQGEGKTITIRNTITGDPDTSAKVIDTIQDKKHILDFVIPRGEKGDEGPNRIRAAYLVTLDSENDSIKFNIPGYYKVSLNDSYRSRKTKKFRGECLHGTERKKLSRRFIGYFTGNSYYSCHHNNRYDVHIQKLRNRNR